MKYYLLSTILSFTLFACSNSPKQSLKVKEETIPSTKLEEDTTIHEMPAITGVLESAENYFKENNRFKDWDSKDKRMVVLMCTLEKDGKAKINKIKESGKKELDEEAIRLIKAAQIIPAKNGLGEPVRSRWTIAVYFPAK